MKKLTGYLFLMTLLPAALMIGCGSSNSPTSSATPTPGVSGPTALSLGAAISPNGNFAVLAGAGITNAGESVCGNLGEYPGSTATGSPVVFTCTNNVSDLDDITGYAQAAQKSVFSATSPLGAYNIGLAMANPTPIPAELGGQSLTPGFYSPVSGSAFTLGSGGVNTLTLNNVGGNPNNVYIFTTGAGSPGSLVTSQNTSIVLTNVKASNVFWIVSSSATLGQLSAFAGTILASTSITFGANAALEGHAFCNTGAVVFGASDSITYP